MIKILQEFFESETENRVEVKTDPAVFRRNLTNPGRLVNGVLKKAIPGGFKQTDLLSRLYVDRSKFETWLLNERCLATRRSVNLADVTAALGYNESEVRLLVSMGKPKWATHRDWQKWIDGRSLFEFMLQKQ